MKLLLLALVVTVSAIAARTSVASEPSQFVSEVILIKYARAADVAAALLKTTNGVATGGIQDTGQPSIVADERTNSLLISATRQDMLRIKDTISRLDVALVPVLIEAVIIQVTGGGSNTLGMSDPGGEPQGPDNNAFAASALSRSNMLSLNRLVPMAETNAPASQPSGFVYLAKPATDLDGMIAALASDSRVKILQRPRIQTSDGVPASLFVGEARPYPTNSYLWEGSAYSSISSVEQLLIGVTFEVTPVVKPDGFLEMEIHQKIDRLAGKVTIQNVGEVPVTSSTEAQAKVVVRDRETILLGGLMETGKPRTPSGVPPLEDLPLLGAKFRGSSARTPPNEIIILIRPTILRGS